jgi:uncharacterized BrkB/YihY/UPF0761 family membrane protein
MSGDHQMIVTSDDESRVGNIARLILCAGRYWSSDNASTTGAALAFFCAFSLAPLLVILLTIAGMVLGEQAAYGDVQAQLQALFGPSTAKTIMGAVQASKHTKGAITSEITSRKWSADRWQSTSRLGKSDLKRMTTPRP